jgi:transposase InsO family protein
MDADARTRLGWVRLYEQVGNAGLVCRRCGISRPTLRKWWRRYQAQGEQGLEGRSRRPHTSPNRKVLAEEEALILRLRRERKLGIKRLRNELARQHGLKLALDTIHKVLVRHGENQFKRPRLNRKGTKRYSRPVPGDRVQMDTCKIKPGLYQYTAIDDCSRWQVLGLYPRRTAANTRDFLKRVLEEMPFPIQRVQTDRGQEFFAYEVQDDLRGQRVKFRPNRPRAPHLNGKVERVQRTALEEFWPTVDLKDPELAARLKDWGIFYNHHRSHGALGGGTPAERIAELAQAIPTPEAVHAAYDPSRLRSKPGVHPTPEHPLPLAPNQHACDMINADPT